ncbi:MAG: adenine nucleotide alpha hydrolase, partial [Chromatiales bacterium]|nr:adenine nucleotide alpha hydrolase [Chromatiales bacterium]
AERFGWQLEVVDAGEFDDLDYLANPHNRCYFCKKNLYHRIAEATETQVFSGANVDDLGDYRPGLIAAREKAVRHPYIEAGVTKANVRDLARMLGLEEVQDLPAMPCLSSRIESGIPINADDLAFVNDIELRLRTQLPAETVRCRIVAQGVRVELGKRALGLMLSDAHTAERDWVEQQCHGSGRTFVGFDTYLRGSAFKVPLTA